MSLAESNLRLHKFASNSQAFLEAFPGEDYAAVAKDVDLSGKAAPIQCSFGLLWEISSDTFKFSVVNVLSTVNSVFDPLDFLAPVTIQGRLLLRELTAELSEWDVPLHEDKFSKWKAWQDLLQELRHFHVLWTYTQLTTLLDKAVHTELCVYSDASIKAISAVAYLKAIQEDGQTRIRFVIGKIRTSV